MTNLFKKATTLMVAISLFLSTSLISLAATYNYTYDFKHQVTVQGTKKATQSTADFSCTTTSNGSSEATFTIKQFKYNAFGTNSYIASRTINCNVGSSSSITDTASFSTTSGTTYTYEFWKNTMVGYIVGSGSLVY